MSKNPVHYFGDVRGREKTSSARGGQNMLKRAKAIPRIAVKPDRSKTMHHFGGLRSWADMNLPQARFTAPVLNPKP